jgi:hypothetical protein
MGKNSSSLAKVLEKKTNRLNWQTFNFLENLLIFCVHPERQVPTESGVQFRITIPESKPCLCLIFKIDRESDPLIKTGLRPDYLVLYIENSRCICTIVEMKGVEKKNNEHGVAQIKALHDRLLNEVRQCLPNKFKPQIQGILLTPFNASMPLKVVSDAQKKGLTVLPLQYKNKAELFPYISKEIRLNEKYLHEEINPRRRDLNLLESILTCKSLHKRFDDDFCRQLRPNPNAQCSEAVYVNYALDGDDYYAALFADKEKCVIGISNGNLEKFAEEIRNIVPSMHNKTLKLEKITASSEISGRLPTTNK